MTKLRRQRGNAPRELNHGSGRNNLRAKLAEIRDLGKTIKTKHDFGLEIWATGNDEARLFATQIFRPK